MNIDHPTPEQVAQLATLQQKRLADLNTYSHWSNSQMEEVLFCMQSWCEERQQWVQDVATLEELAFDSRIPAAYAHKLQTLLRHWRESGQLETDANRH